MSYTNYYDTPTETTQEQYEQQIAATREEAERRSAGISNEQIKTLRKLLKTNLWALSQILGYKDLSPNLHGHFCTWLDATMYEQFRLTLLPRGHIKSTVQTVAESIQTILPDDSNSLPIPYCMGPEGRILICHEVDTTAQMFLFEISQQITTCPELALLFPEIIPDPKKHRMNLSELELPRKTRWKEKTFSVMGVGAASQGKHFDMIKADDLYGLKARDSEAEHNRTIGWVNNIESFFVNAKEGRLDFIGTRYSHTDLYAHIQKVYGNKLKRYIRPIQERQPDGTLAYIYPERFDEDQATRLRKDPKVWVQYTNNPDIHGKEFDDKWKRFYKFKDTYTVEFRDITGKLCTSDTRDMDRVVLIDPAMKGLAGVVVTGVDANNRIFTLEALKREWRPPELVQEIFRLVSRWNPRTVVIEEVLFSGLFQHWLESEMRLRNRRFLVEPCKTNNKQKDIRVRGLSNYFSGGLIFFAENQYDLIEEFDQFGATDNYHMLDAMAQGPLFWRKGQTRKMIEEQQKAIDSILGGRDSISGYSSYTDED